LGRIEGGVSRTRGTYRDERDVGHSAIGLAEKDDVDSYGEEGGHGPDHLVEGNGDEIAIDSHIGSVCGFVNWRGGSYSETLLMAMLMV